MANIIMAFSIPMIAFTGVLIWIYFIEKESRKENKKK